MSDHRFVTIMTDGSSKGNQHNSPASIGYVIKNEQGDVIDRHAEVIGNTNALVAEYSALLSAIEQAKTQHKATHIVALSDSLNMVKHINDLDNIYMRQPPPIINQLKAKIQAAIHPLETFHLSHIYREFNNEADTEANRAYSLSKTQELYDTAVS